MTTTTTAKAGPSEAPEADADADAGRLRPRPIEARDVPPAARTSNLPEPFASMMEGRVKRKLGDHFGLTNFGVNLTTLQPGGISALKHHHGRQEEFIYILTGRPSLIYGEAEYQMEPGECFGFKCNTGMGHQLINRSISEDVTYLEIGDRTVDDRVVYPENDLCAVSGRDGSWSFTHKDGTPYPST
jgi:uncharacterized cupin superfamily protein